MFGEIILRIFEKFSEKVPQIFLEKFGVFPRHFMYFCSYLGKMFFLVREYDICEVVQRTSFLFTSELF